MNHLVTGVTSGHLRCPRNELAALRSVNSIDLFSLLAFRFSSAVTCAQPLAVQAPADGSEKFSPLARSRQNFLGPGVALRPLMPTRFSFARRRKKWPGTRPGHFHSKGNDMQNIRLRTATDVLSAIPALLGLVPANSVVMIALTGSPATFACVARTDVIGSGPAAAAGLDQIEASEREFDSVGIRSIRTLVAESRSERGGSTPTARCLTSNACSPSHAISCSDAGSLWPLGRASAFRPCSPAGLGTPPKAFV